MAIEQATGDLSVCSRTAEELDNWGYLDVWLGYRDSKEKIDEDLSNLGRYLFTRAIPEMLEKSLGLKRKED